MKGPQFLNRIWSDVARSGSVRVRLTPAFNATLLCGARQPAHASTVQFRSIPNRPPTREQIPGEAGSQRRGERSVHLSCADGVRNFRYDRAVISGVNVSTGAGSISTKKF